MSHSLAIRSATLADLDALEALEGRAFEGDLTPADLDDGFFIGNALRGLVPARLER